NLAASRILSKLKEELATIRTGRATPAILENIQVESYGTTLPLKQLASLSVQQPNIIIVQPWDKEILLQIEHAIRDSGIGVIPIAEKEVIKVALPPLTEERRKELLKLLTRKTEDAKIAFRLARDEARKKLLDMLSSKQIREDDKFRGNEQIQKETDKFNEGLENLLKAKEKEILGG
ncbi:MAG: ribosome recycling factor, partial [Candidatus Paceibacteria bacterium]